MPPDPQTLSLTLSGEVSVRPNGEGSKTAPVDLVANSGNPVDYPRLGLVVWDFASMAHKSKMPLDWEHKDTIGYINHFDAGDGSLKLSGSIIPAGKGPAAEIAEDIIAKMAAGVPYEASIHSEGGRLEKIAAGESVTVNGKPFAGPLSVLRGWRLASTAICKFGRDSETLAALRLAASKDEDFDMKLTDDQLGKVKLALGQNPPADLSADNGLDLLLAHSEKQAQAITAQAGRIADLEKTAGTKPTPPSARDLFFAGQALNGLRTALSAKIEAFITAGDQTKAITDAMRKTCIRRNADVSGLTLSRNTQASDEALMEDIAAEIEQTNFMLDVLETFKGSKIGVVAAGAHPAVDVQDDWLKASRAQVDEKKLAEDGAAAGKAYQDQLLASRGLK